MPSRKRAKRSFSRRFFLFALFIVLVILAYTGAWFYAADTLEQRTITAIEDLNAGHQRANCEEPTARGYPFRIGLFCRSVFYEDAENGMSVSAGAFRSAAQVYQPMRTVGELDAPARIATPYLPAIEADWENMRISARLTASLPERLSSEAKNVVLTLDDDNRQPIARAGNIQAHTRQNGTDLDLALIAQALTIDPGLTNGTAIPAIDGELLVTLDDGVALASTSVPELRGRSGTIENLNLKIAGGNAGLTVKGPIRIAENGLIDAELRVTVNEPQRIAQLVGQIVPDKRDEIAGITAGLANLGAAPRLAVNIRQGRVFVGFLPLGSIPPVR
ncbi:hypothetical protein SAMN05216452_1742 [Nitratireductor aquibiodomus]|uniref:DUF2125 domain-containing protein n=1 Tax=Nitratireductor aquibiodomus TaxID=204799 RepID=A0A1H4JY26_9HYPH|nr:DUF2125 domain-containing protein [Nitratireductor aquibiodomus]SEB50532.1 hypothetical protein SAMN05216452_1742 [Nitratireductor aquibiodomus]